MNAWLDRFGVLLHSYSDILFIRDRMAGVLLFSVTMFNPNVGLSGLVSLAAAYLFSRLIGMEKSFLQSGFFTYNALLVGLSVGYLFSIGPLSLFLVAVTGVLSFVLSVALNSIFSLYLKLPILSLPFVLVSSMTWLASQGYGGLYVNGLSTHTDSSWLNFPAWIEGFLCSLGAILFVPQAGAGLVMALVILYHSRIMFLLALGGYYLGAILSALLVGDFSQIFSDINYFNYILIAVALGGVYLVPSPRGYLIAAIGVAVATLLLSAVRLFWANYGIPVFTLPFNMVTLAFIYVLGSVGFPLVARSIRNSPEETLDEYISNSRRFGEVQIEINLPLSGSWSVWQGFDGEWTHRGSLRHAYDFVIKHDDLTHKGDGRFLEDYYAWGKSVLAPCRGRVIRVVNNLPDNPPGHVDSQHNWGNLIIIDTGELWWVELSHFSQGSIRVEEGDWVEPGTLLGLCGNSGYSSQPHIHIQVQSDSAIGSATLPFRFKGYLQKGEFISRGLPKLGANVEPLFADRGLEYRTAFPLETTLQYRVMRHQKQVGELNLRVAMGVEGESYFESPQGRLYFARDTHSFYFYRLEGDDPALALMFAALPRLPLVYRHDMQWQDMPPLSAVTEGWRKHLINLARACSHKVGCRHYMARWSGGGAVHGMVELGSEATQAVVEVTLHPKLGFSQLRVGEHCLILEEITPCAG